MPINLPLGRRMPRNFATEQVKIRHFIFEIDCKIDCKMDFALRNNNFLPIY